jgi:putative FmdB family regulatory protein
MAMYEFECTACGKRFEVKMQMAEHDRVRDKGVTCPACGKPGARALAPLIGYKAPAS